MPSTIAIAKAIFLIAGLRVVGYDSGVAAYYSPGLMEEVCRHRTDHNWTELDCDWPCLVAGIEQDSLGEWWLVDLPGGSIHLCHVVDVGATHDLDALRGRGEVVEVSWKMAQECGWTGYTPNVRVWRLDR